MMMMIMINSASGHRFQSFLLCQSDETKSVCLVQPMSETDSDQWLSFFVSTPESRCGL